MNKLTPELLERLNILADEFSSDDRSLLALGFNTCFEAMSKMWIDKLMAVRELAFKEADHRYKNYIPLADVEILIEALQFYAQGCTEEKDEGGPGGRAYKALELYRSRVGERETK